MQSNSLKWRKYEKTYMKINNKKPILLNKYWFFIVFQSAYRHFFLTMTVYRHIISL